MPVFPPRSVAPAGADRVIMCLIAVVAWITLLSYLFLIGAGHWGSDEYFISLSDQNSGFRGAFDRLLHWSPRPVSELLSGAYLVLCQRLHRPLVIPFLALLWGGAFGLVALAARQAREARPVLVACLLLILVLTLEQPNEMFYWPMAAVAYLTGWAGLAAATLLRRSGRHAELFLPMSLILAAWSVEMAASVVMADALLSPIVAVRGTRRRIAYDRLLPGLAAALVCVTVYLGRMRPMTEVLDPHSGLAGHWLRCIELALPTFGHELLAVPGLPLLLGIAIKLTIVMALPPAASNGTNSVRSRMVWAFCLLLGAFLSIVMSFQQFGMLCCQRHQTMRQGMIVLALVTLAPSGRMSGRPRQAAFAAALLLLLAIRIPDLRADVMLVPASIKARVATWTSAEAPGTGMVLYVPSAGRLFGGPTWPFGTTRLPPDRPPRYGPEGIAAFFGKREIIVEPWK